MRTHQSVSTHRCQAIVVLPYLELQQVITLQVFAGQRQTAARCQANIAAASAVLDIPAKSDIPQEVTAAFSKLQNGSDIRGIAIAGQALSPLH